MPEYLGKKIEAYEMKMASLAILIRPSSPWGAPAHRGRHGGGSIRRFESGRARIHPLLYAFSSTANNNAALPG